MCTSVIGKVCGHQQVSPVGPPKSDRLVEGAQVPVTQSQCRKPKADSLHLGQPRRREHHRRK
jgi:hypothetical protein